MILSFPFPPSTNTYWRNVTIKGHGRTLISDRGRAYRRAVQEICLLERLGLDLRGPIACTLDLYPPDARRRDCDNYAKALLDAMTHAHVYGDDSQIVDLRIRMHPKRPPGEVIVTLNRIQGGLQAAHEQINLLEAS